MLKERTIHLIGKDAGTRLRLTERPAMVADRLARHLLKVLDAEPAGGVVALAYEHAARAARLPDHPLLGFVNAGPAFDLARDVRDWRNVERIEQAALALHVDFLVGREQVAAPITLRAQQIMRMDADIQVTFCSAQIAAVLESKHATYVELETVLSTEDVFNLVEVLNVTVIREWDAQQRANREGK